MTDEFKTAHEIAIYAGADSAAGAFRIIKRDAVRESYDLFK